MDTPDNTFSVDRGLLADPPSPPMRMERHSELSRGPISRQSQMHLVTSRPADTDDPLPASPGIKQLEGATVSAFEKAVPLQLAPNQVGHVFRGEGRLTTDFERRDDSAIHRFAPASAQILSSDTDRGYMSGNVASLMSSSTQTGRYR